MVSQQRQRDQGGRKRTGGGGAQRRSETRTAGPCLGPTCIPVNPPSCCFYFLLKLIFRMMLGMMTVG
ncbi:hypothetical protein Hanom_Chr08g00684011 [Helianthus anomalus]